MCTHNVYLTTVHQRTRHVTYYMSVHAVCDRDVFWKGSCDDGCYHLADQLGWKVSFFSFVSTD